MKKSFSILFFLFTLTNVYGGVNSLGFTNVTTKFDALDDTKKLEFYYDFRNKEYALARLNANDDLINTWEEVLDELPHFRNDIKDITFLESYDRLTQNTYELFHITDLKNKAPGTGFDPIGAHAGKNLTNGVYRDPSLPSPIPGKPATSIKVEKNGHILYSNMWYNRPGGGTPKRVSEKTIWNPDWDDLRIKGEMAFAIKNKTLKVPTINTKIVLEGYSPPPIYKSIYKSHLSDGTEVEMELYNFRYDPISNDIQTNYLGYFKLILD